MEEPSILDYLKQKLSLRRILRHEDMPLMVGDIDADIEPAEDHPTIFVVKFFRLLSKIPWRCLSALILALIAQSQLEPPSSNALWGIFFYIASGCMLAFAVFKKEWLIPSHEAAAEKQIGLNVRFMPLLFFIILIFGTFLSFGGNRFSLVNLTLWIATLLTGLWAFWEPEKPVDLNVLKGKLAGIFDHSRLIVKIDPWKILVVGVFLLSAWFHLYQLDTIPVNMTSDHAEKILDVNNILNGQYDIFFMNNGGREPIQFYLAAFLAKVSNIGLSFFNLKLTMALAFLLSLVYVYRLGKEMGSRWTGLFFMALLGFASWTNMIARVGLRVVLAPVFVTPLLFYFFRGIRTSRRNDFILAGIFLGLGLLGYSAFRIMPLVVVAGIVLHLAYQKFSSTKRNTWWALGLLTLFAVVMALPLLRFAIDYPGVFGYRTLTRMTSTEQPLAGNIFAVFMQNFWNAISMPFWKDGNTWVISVPGRPGLDVVSAALYFLGLCLVVYRWLHSRSWQDLFLLVSIPLLMLPSILALAFPEENPSLSRAGGAAIPVFLVCAIGLETVLTSLWKKSSGVTAKSAVVILGIALIGFSALQNYDIALNQYPAEYKNATWNTSQMGNVARDFIALTGNAENVWVVGVPHWADTRLVAISAGFVGSDYAIWPEEIDSTLSHPGAKLFIVKYNDLEGMDTLHKVYPNGFAVYHSSEIEGRDFFSYIVPPGD